MISLISIKDHGSLDTERAVFNVTSDGNIGSQVVLCSRSATKKDGTRQLQNVIYSSYWFIDKEVSVGDIVVLYTKDPGLNYKVREREGKPKTHFFYWRSDKALWARDGVALVNGVLKDWFAHHVDHNDLDIEP